MANLRSCGPADPPALLGATCVTADVSGWARPDPPARGAAGIEQACAGEEAAPAPWPAGPGLRAPAPGLSLSAAGCALLQAVETLRLKPYDDQSGADIVAWVSGATIGYGHLIQEADWPAYAGGITAAAASELFDKDAVPFVAVVRSSITAQLTQNEFDALVILAYNIGCPGFAGSSVARLVNDPAAKTGYPGLEAAWKAWNRSQGKVMPGLVKRRQCEWDIYSLGVYTRW